MSSKLTKLLSEIARDGVITQEEFTEMSEHLRTLEKENDSLRELVQRLLINLNSVSSKLAAKFVSKFEAINVSKTLNPEFYEVSIAPQMLRLKLPFDDASLWDIEVQEQMAEALADEIMRVLKSKDKRVHIKH